MEDGFSHGTSLLGVVLLCKEVGVGLHFAEEVGDGAVGVVQYGVFQVLGAHILSDDSFMHMGICEGGAALVVEADVPVRMPPAPLDMFSVKDVMEGDGIDGVGGEGKGGELIDEGRGEDLIAVEGEDPVVGG